jgi:hypothetical protein
MPFIVPPSTGYAGSIQRVDGYRPLEVTLTFKDGSKAVPDSIGLPSLGSAYFVGPEILLKSTANSSVQSQFNTVSIGSPIVGTNTSTVVRSIYKTSQSPILWGGNGASIRVFWHSSLDSLPSTNDIPIQPDRLIVDSKLGLVELLEAPPAGKDSLVAYYYTAVTETTPRITQSSWDSMVNSTVAGEIGFNTSIGLSQVYPITRNRTDYLTGKDVELKLPVLDKTSPDYYPVFEYKEMPGGVLQFSVPLHELSDQPATIEVKYKSLDLKPRLIVDIVKDDILTSLNNLQISVAN